MPILRIFQKSSMNPIAFSTPRKCGTFLVVESSLRLTFEVRHNYSFHNNIYLGVLTLDSSELLKSVQLSKV